MTQEMINLLKDLADVLEKHRGGLRSTRDNDGVHVDLVGCESVVIGFPQDGDVLELQAIIDNTTGDK